MIKPAQQTWNRQFQAAIYALLGDQHYLFTGPVDWDFAARLYDQKFRPVQAADRYLSLR